jgi:hypothetical protein
MLIKKYIHKDRYKYSYGKANSQKKQKVIKEWDRAVGSLSLFLMPNGNWRVERMVDLK